MMEMEWMGSRTRAVSQWWHTTIDTPLQRCDTAIRSEKPHGGAMTFDEDLRQRLGEDVSRHVFGGKVVDLDCLLVGDFVSNPEFLNRDVLHARMMHSVVEHLYGGLVVEVER